jgi:hypothetical protein
MLVTGWWGLGKAPEPSPMWSYVKAVKFDGVPGVIGGGFYLD